MGLFMLANGFFWLVLLVGIGFLFYAAVRGWPGPVAASVSGADPLSILAGRYARGEIDRDQFLQMRQDLGAPQAGGKP